MLCQRESFVSPNGAAIITFGGVREHNKNSGHFFLGQAVTGVLHHKAQTDLFG
jgi:hypothetical protein